MYPQVDCRRATACCSTSSSDQPVAFWMHNTYISLDMIFIRGDGRILRIAENAEPMSDRLIPSGGPVGRCSK